MWTRPATSIASIARWIVPCRQRTTTSTWVGSGRPAKWARRFSITRLDMSIRVSSVALYAPAGEGAGSVLTEVRILRGGNNEVPFVEHRTAVAAVQDMEAGIKARDRALAEAPAPRTAARPRLADALGLQTAAREVGPIDPALEDGNAAARQGAVLRAAQRRPDMARGALTKALSDPDTVVRQRAVQGLVQIGGEEAVTALSQVLLEDPEARVRRMAAAGLGRMNTESAFWALMEASSDADQDVREAVSAALVGLERRGIAAGNRSGAKLQ